MVTYKIRVYKKQKGTFLSLSAYENIPCPNMYDPILTYCKINGL